MDEKFDCIVVGGGPAGSMSAITLAEKGVEVLLLEKHPRIGVPLCCAEAISFAGLSKLVEPDPQWINCQIHQVLLVSPSNEKLLVQHPKAGFILNRKLFDRKLAQKASSLGARVRTGACVVGLLQSKKKGFCGVRVMEDGREREYQARVIIGADGVESWVARWAGIDSSLTLGEIESCAQYLLEEVEVEADRVEFYLGRAVAPGGYAWVFPKGDRTANAGVAIAPHQASGKAKEFLDRLVQKRFPHFRVIESTMGGVPCFGRGKSLVKDNVLLVGDAGRLVDSLSGAGISNALLSGKIAGEVVGEFIREGKSSFSTLRRYEEKFLKEKGRELRFYSFCRAIFLKMTDEDVDRVVSFLKEYFSNRVVTAIHFIPLAKAVLRSTPQLLPLLRHLSW